MAVLLRGNRVAIVAADGFEQAELLEPRKALQEAGVHVDVVAQRGTTVRGWSAGDWGEIVQADKSLDDISPEDYDAVLIPGGPLNVDALRTDQRAIDFVHKCHDAKETIGAIGYAPLVLSEAAIVDGRELTSAASIANDLMNAGAIWVDAIDVNDEGIVTSRGPADLRAFCAKFIEQLGKAPHQRRGRPGHHWMRRPIREEPEVEFDSEERQGDR